ncbi:MAG TPA: magnesium chelatase, partial [Clostridiaceae bacterium]|nr:magnesium chelatase [Clostridiaceae bacterium]
VESVIVGKRKVVEKISAALISGGHVLLEDVPGVGKTIMVRALAKSLGCSFKRIQFTPDLLPSDITGVSVFNQKTGDFEFKAGPVMNQIILADEINRTSPKTQSSLLEVMEEHQVTADGKTYSLKKPFMVLATQNPIEYEGTFPLPEAQLDRFMMKISIGYPVEDEEKAILRRFKTENPIDSLKEVLTSDDILEIQDDVKKIYVDDSIDDYIINIVRATRNNPDILLGASPRGSLALFRVSQAWAIINGREYVLPDDVKNLAKSVLGHRLIVKPEVKLRGITSDDIMSNILGQVHIPIVRRYVQV